MGKIISYSLIYDFSSIIISVNGAERGIKIPLYLSRNIMNGMRCVLHTTKFSLQSCRGYLRIIGG